MVSFRRFLAVSLIVSITGLGLPLPTQAAMLSTDSALAAAQRDRITAMLEREDVRLRLESYGVNPSDVKARVAALGDQEVAQLAARIDTLPVGADGLGALVGALVLIFLVLLITDLLGLTHVFPFTKPIR
ncbi:MAG TPA: PA2779 family protein [Burkholderiales bacterium]